MRFKAVGNAPIMKQNFYKITASNRFQAVIQFLRKELGWKQGDPLVSNLSCAHGDHVWWYNISLTSSSLQFTYINLAFSPAPDDTVANLFKVSICFITRAIVQMLKESSVLLDGWTPNSQL